MFITTVQKLNFSKTNAKLDVHENIFSFSLLAGHTCPFAKDCLSFVDLKTRKLKDGKKTKFRCFSASNEIAFPSVFRSRKANYDVIRKCKSVEDITQVLLHNLPETAQIIRIHVSGDFFSQNYFDAWVEVAKQKPDVLFYGYTKAIPFWINRLNDIPSNFSLTASLGGKRDDLVSKYNLKYAKVVYSPEEANTLGLLIDHDDKLAMFAKESFALLLHGIQPKDSEASFALQKLKQQGIKFNYTRS